MRASRENMTGRHARGRRTAGSSRRQTAVARTAAPPKRSLFAVEERLVAALSRRFDKQYVKRQWPAFTGADGHYSPRLDIAVGPFAVGDLELGPDYDRLAVRHQDFLECRWESHRDNLQGFNGWPVVDLDFALSKNFNARCFLAIEIENQVSRKHLMGGAVNAIALGRLGIVVGWTEDKVRALIRLRRYLLFLASVRKPTLDVDNLFVLTKQQLLRSIAEFCAPR